VKALPVGKRVSLVELSFLKW